MVAIAALLVPAFLAWRPSSLAVCEANAPVSNSLVMADANAKGLAAGWACVRGLGSPRSGLAQKEIAGIRFDGHEIVRIRRFQPRPEPLFVNRRCPSSPFGRELGSHGFLPLHSRRRRSGAPLYGSYRKAVEEPLDPSRLPKGDGTARPPRARPSHLPKERGWTAAGISPRGSPCPAFATPRRERGFPPAFDGLHQPLRRLQAGCRRRRGRR